MFKVFLFALVLVSISSIPYPDQMALANSLIVGGTNQSAPTTNWTCKVCDASNKPLHSHIIEEKQVDVKCIVSVYAQFIILAFRYTNTALNVWQDILYPVQIEDEHTCSGCRVQKAYHTMWESIKVDVMADLTQIQLQTKIKKLIITGISLGGGLAVISYIDISHANIYDIVVVTTFGAPRVGNKQWAIFFDKQTGGKSERYIVAGDPVVDLPRCLTLLCSYQQTGIPLVCYENQSICRVELPNPGVFRQIKHLAHDIIHPRPNHSLGSIMDHVDGYPKIYNFTVVW